MRSALSAWLALAMACGAASSPQSSVPPQAPPVASEAPPRADGADVRLRLATFNIQVLGPTKAGKPEVLTTLARVIRQYDLVAIQEIKDRSGKAPLRLLEAVNAPGAPRYALALSERTGRQPDDRRSQEQYAYLYRTERLRLVGEGTLYDDEPHDHFQREPYLSRFAILGSDATFVLINVHTRPRAAVSEIGAIEHVFTWAREHFAGEEVFIALGDFNAGCGYASEEDLDALPVHGEAYDWVVPHSADTNLAESQCPYDRIVIAAPQGTDLADEWGVDEAFHDRAVSDHWPVWVNLRFAR